MGREFGSKYPGGCLDWQAPDGSKGTTDVYINKDKENSWSVNNTKKKYYVYTKV